MKRYVTFLKIVGQSSAFVEIPAFENAIRKLQSSSKTMLRVAGQRYV